MKTLQHDTEFENARLFYHYVMVMKEGKMIGGGLIEAYNEFAIQIGNKLYERENASFIEAPAPQASI
ncbi:hypothetical protein HZF08_04520 [Paenibacillus sp. CGMCC 1.16610]|uniref:Uncharacterized protein n=1 Tax=Paenibacillus anseongense TaxID=2682845 RepID=A0ABW9UFH5_9BACL|nr:MULTISPECIES: hypothetical protein [Paenibacillus]MBA2937557.1 hypothetical protein [Paenibacillus sp. CGMCC 1.16610]MVQ36615.1 hypothetical protein [Paenibacillus anseongense]